MINKEKKKEVVKELSGFLGDSESVVFVNFHGLSVTEISNIRRSLKKEGVGYKVAKKTLINRVLDSLKIAGNKPEFAGELAIAYLSGGEDKMSPARGVYEFQKKLSDKISIIGGIFEGKYASREHMTEIASIPSLQVLRGMFVNIINSPIQRFAISLNEIARLKD